MAFIIFITSLDRAFSTMDFSAPKGTSEVLSTSISGMGKKKDPTVPALSQTPSQVGFFLEHRMKKLIILYDKTTNPVAPIPIRFESKKRLNLDYKKAKCSLMSRMYSGMPSLSLIIRLWKIFRYNEGLLFVKAKLGLYRRVFLKCINLAQQRRGNLG